MNEVDEFNFNETCKGYLKRAIKNMNNDTSEGKDNLTKEQEKRLWSGLRWAFDEMTMEDARDE